MSCDLKLHTSCFILNVRVQPQGYWIYSTSNLTHTSVLSAGALSLLIAEQPNSKWTHSSVYKNTLTKKEEKHACNAHTDIFGHSRVRVWFREIVLSLISVVFPVCVMRLESLSSEEGVTARERRETAIRASLDPPTPSYHHPTPPPQQVHTQRHTD